jgi:hypothetical protein
VVVHLSVDELGQCLDEVLFERVARGERFLVYLDGEPAAYVLHPDDPLVPVLDPARPAEIEES